MSAKQHTDDKLTRLLDKARHYCSTAEQCVATVKQKLATWGASPADADTIVGTLCRDGYLDDVRYARAYCESKILSQQWGRQKVLYQLRMKHLPREAVEAGLAAIADDDYRAVLHEIAEKKRLEIERSETDPLRQRQKLMAFLASRGFLASEITQEINQLSNTNDL